MDQQDASLPDIADRHRRLRMWAFLFVAVELALATGRELVGPTGQEFLRWVIVGVAVIALGLVLPVKLFRSRGMSAGARALYHADGFGAEASRRATEIAFRSTLTIVALGFGFLVITDYPVTLPVSFFAGMLLAFMFGVQGAAFLYLDRANDTEELEDHS